MGPLGIKVAELIASRKGIITMAAVDNNPTLVGRKLSELSDKLHPELIIRESIAKAIYLSKPDVAIVTTVSDMQRITPQIEEILAYNIPIISTCEELSYPWDAAADLANKIDQLAKQSNVAVLGTGVNPGFLMDALPAFLTAMNQNVESIHVKRYQNAATRRVPFQKKIGAGLSIDEFEQKKKEGTIRHVGLTESMQFIAASIGWSLDRTTDNVSAAFADQEVKSPDMVIRKGEVTGVNQIGTAYIGDEKKITLEFIATVGEQHSYDEVIIKGLPEIKSKIKGGVNGDQATCAVAVNATASILKARPGLLTMADMPMISFFN